MHREPDESLHKLLARGELAPRLSLVPLKVFSPFCHRWNFGSLPLSPLACLVGYTYNVQRYRRLACTDTIRVELIWMMTSLNAFNWKFSVYYCTFALPTHNFPIWYCKATLTNSVMLKALYKQRWHDSTWLDLYYCCTNNNSSTQGGSRVN